MSYHGEIPEFRKRYRWLVVVVVVSFLMLIGRLWQLQLVRGEHYQLQSQDNFVQKLRISTVRGRVFDRRRRPLVINRPSYDVYVTPRFLTDDSFERLIRELALDPQRADVVRKRVVGIKGRRRFQQLSLLRDITRDQFARLETKRDDLAGVSVAAVAHRSYVHGNLLAHVLGYLNEVSGRDLERDKKKIYQSGDMIGRFGIERMYEAHLRGVHGSERIVVDAKGHRKGEGIAEQLLGKHRRVEPQPGHDLILTIDLDLQRLAERALRHYPSGAAVVLEVQTGRILASASRPAFDPNVLTGRLSVAEHRRLVEDPHRPLLDKVFRENYFPGSTYKVVTAIAGLEEGHIDWEERIVCKRYYMKYRVPKRCSHAHGRTHMHDAIVQSCNIFFYNLAERVGLDTMARYARMFGLGAATGLGLNHEVSGFIPDKSWYAARKRPFRVGYSLNAAIGQGNVKATPIQIANLYATIANGGKLFLPQIVERIETSSGKLIQAFEPRLRRMIRVKPETLSGIRQALRGVVDDREGTAYDARLQSVAVSGKTGTAQVARRLRKKKKSFWLNDHSWFAAYAPSDAPEIAVAVLIEHGGRAAKVAAPVAMEIVRGYFRYVRPYGGSARKPPMTRTPDKPKAPHTTPATSTQTGRTKKR
jgi:penicillin-binding protein 2